MISVFKQLVQGFLERAGNLISLKQLELNSKPQRLLKHRLLSAMFMVISI